MDDNLWLIQLESALLDDCTVNDISAICNGKTIPEHLRPDVWQICLDVRHKMDQMSQFNEIYDLPFQFELRQDCEQFVEKIGNDDGDKVSIVSDLESILTFYCKTRQLRYETNNGWIDLLSPLLSLKLSRSYTYNLFETIRDTYIPKGCFKEGNVFHVFRLLILYHDPELCSMLDTKKITPDLYSTIWFQSLFAATCPFRVVLAMWDIYFQQTDPYLVFFLSLIMLVNGRDQILSMRNESKEKIIEYLINMPCALELDDVSDFCSLAQYISRKTPASFKTDYLMGLFGTHQETAKPDCIVSQALCLPASVYELVENASIEIAQPDSVRFFLVDCRPAEQYNVGHLSTAFHLDSNLMLQEPSAFATAVQGLLRAQTHAIDANSNAGGEHLCFMGSGCLDKDQYTHMVVASFLQKNTKYVSLLTGGYESIHDYFGEHMADCLEDHDPIKCIICSKNSNNRSKRPKSPSSIRLTASTSSSTPTTMTTKMGQSKDSEKRPSSDLFSKFSSVMKIKSAEVKGKLFDYIVNPNTTTPGTNYNNHVNGGGGGAGTGNNQYILEKHVQSNDRQNGKRYRNQAPVFTIDDDNDDQQQQLLNSQMIDTTDMMMSVSSTTTNYDKEIVNLNNYLKLPEVIESFKCQEVQMNGFMYDSYLIVTKTHIVVLRDLNDRKNNNAQVIVRRPLSSIVKITAKKRHPDLITFKYGVPDNETLIITDMDRFLIPNASNATAIVSKYIVKQLEITGRN